MRGPTATSTLAPSRVGAFGANRSLPKVREETEAVLHLQLFGRMRLTFGAREIDFAPRPSCVPLLAYLALNAGRAVPRRELAFALWPDEPEEDALGNLRRHLHLLSGALPDSDSPWILIERATVAWNRDAPWSNDAELFEGSLASPTSRAAAIAHYRDDLALDVTGDWVVPYRDRYRALAIETLELLCAEHWTRHETNAALKAARALLRIEPLHETTVRTLMAMECQVGDRAAALKTYQSFTTRLKLELDVEPMARTRAIVETIERGAAPFVFPNNLPAHLTSFIGRELELSQAARELEQTRLLSLVGAAGIGKTRLAVALAALEAARYEDGVFFADFSVAADEPAAMRVLASALGVTTLAEREPFDAVRQTLADRSVLLILDNCEHIIDIVARICERLLRAATRLRVVATSREPLRLSAERLWPVPPLAEGEARALFVERSGRPALETELAAIQAICARLDGLPLAIELVAVAARSAPLAELHVRLSADEGLRMLEFASRTDLERHRSLRTALDWSASLLEPSERRLLERLSLFVGGATHESVSAICLPEENVDAELRRLVEASLVQASSVGGFERFRLLETVRAYGLDRVRTDPELPRVRDHIARYFADLAMAAAPHFLADRQAEWFARIEAEHPNVDATLRWCFESDGDRQVGARLAYALRHFWEFRGYYAEAERWLGAALDHAPFEQKVDLLISLGSVEIMKGNLKEALERFSRAEEMARAVGYERGLVRALNSRAHAIMHRVSHSEARPILEELERRPRQSSEDEYMHAIALGNLAFVELNDGNESRSLDLYHEALAIFERLDDRRQVAWITHQLSRVEFFRRDLPAAAALERRALEIRETLGERRGIAESKCGLGDIALAQSAADRAEFFLVHAAQLSRETGWKRGIVVSAEGLAQVELLRGRAERAAALLAAAAAYRSEHSLPLDPVERIAYDRLCARIREAVGGGRYDELRARGAVSDLHRLLPTA